MIPEEVRKKLESQHYSVIGNHSAVQICGWTKNSLRDEGNCYKQKFYGIESHKCCQMSPNISCPNRCVHCWASEDILKAGPLNPKKEDVDEPKFIIDKAIEAQRKLISGFKGSDKTNIEKFEEAQEPDQFAISLIGEPTIYPKLGELIKELRTRGKSSFLVSNGLYPEKIKKLQENNNLPTQVYLSLNTPNKEMYKEWHKSQYDDAWERFNKSLELLKNLDTRTVLRITVVRDYNMIEPENYAKLVKKADPDFLEIKSFMSIGEARKRLGYDLMSDHEETKQFGKKILEFLPNYKLLSEHERSRVVLLGKDKNKMKIKKNEI